MGKDADSLLGMFAQPAPADAVPDTGPQVPVDGAPSAAPTSSDLLHLYGQQVSAPTPPVSPTAAPTQPPQWSDLPGNILPSAGHFISNMAYPFLHPVAAAKGVYSVATDPDARAAVAQFYKNRYGGLQNLHDSLITDPVGVAADLSTALTLGGSLAARAPGIVGDIGEAASTAGNIVDPVANAGRAISATGKVAGKVVGTPLAWTIGKSTLAGTDAIKTAFKSGQDGTQEFLDNLRGNVAPTDVLNDVSQGINQIRNNAQAEYAKNFPNAKTPIDTQPIHTAYDNFVQSVKTPAGKFKVGDDEASRIQGVKKAIDDFTTVNGSPAPQDVFELDGLKQKLNSLYPDSNKFGQLQRGISAVTTSIRNAITAVHPVYAQVMAKYGDALDMINDMRQTLAQKGNSPVGTQMMRLSRALTTTPEGERTADLVNTIQDASGKPIMAQLAGQRLSSWLPGHGPTKLLPAIVEGGILGSALTHPGALAAGAVAAPFMSPRIMGEAAYGTGVVGRGLGQGLDYLPLTAIGRGAVQLGRPLQALQAARAQSKYGPYNAPMSPDDELARNP